MAVAVELSNRQLQRRFKAEKGCCPLPYLRHLRLEKAVELLCTTQESVRAIASRVGLSDFSHFVRDFRAVYGVSPAAFRQANAAQHVANRHLVKRHKSRTRQASVTTTNVHESAVANPLTKSSPALLANKYC